MASRPAPSDPLNDLLGGDRKRPSQARAHGNAAFDAHVESVPGAAPKKDTDEEQRHLVEALRARAPERGESCMQRRIRSGRAKLFGLSDP